MPVSTITSCFITPIFALHFGQIMISPSHQAGFGKLSGQATASDTIFSEYGTVSADEMTPSIN